MVGIGTAILVAAALGIGQPVFAPLMFALFIIAIVWPVQGKLQARLPKLVALLISMITAIVTFGAFAYLTTWAFSHVGRYAVAEAGQFQVLYTQMTDWLAGHGIEVSDLWAEHFNVGWLLSAAQRVTTMVNGMLSFSLVVLIYIILGLLEVEPVVRRLRRMTNQAAAQVLLVGGAKVAAKYRRYMLVRSLMSAVTGLLVYGFILLCGLPLAREWGIIAFAFNYIPVIGPLLATVLPTLFAVAQFDTWQSAVLVFGALNLIQFLVGSYLEPRVAGNVLAMSPFLVLFAVFFWTWLWGLAGAFIGVPIVIAILTLCDQHPASRWVVEVFGAAPDERD
ncbi:MAG: AI-2E family transporter [Proteobacteria bacterium]|nr:AI-2E family transporter [Pseudomonadota bacterium]